MLMTARENDHHDQDLADRVQQEAGEAEYILGTTRRLAMWARVPQLRLGRDSALEPRRSGGVPCGGWAVRRVLISSKDNGVEAERGSPGDSREGWLEQDYPENYNWNYVGQVTDEAVRWRVADE